MRVIVGLVVGLLAGFLLNVVLALIFGGVSGVPFLAVVLVCAFVGVMVGRARSGRHQAAVPPEQWGRR
jgi:hypothetical protein